nr:cytochrome c oxidase subunit II [Gemmatimonadaceae bacterium]
MPVPLRPRRPLVAALTAVFSLLGLAGCYGPSHPNSIFTNFTDWNRDVGFLFDVLIIVGVAVFVFVEVLLIYTIWRYRQRPGQGQPEQVHGNTTLEILWTVIPAIILVFIAVPTVQVIFKTQAKVKPGALQVEVIGRQWWWEFRYPEYTTVGGSGRVDTLVTANELYLPLGRTVNFTLRTADVLHSFWIAPLAGKRDLISNHTNYLWFTPDSAGVGAWNGTCNEYCGASHANMKFRAYTVTPEDFESWAQNQLAPAVGTAPAVAAVPAGAGMTAPGQAPPIAQMPVSQATLMPSPIPGITPDTASLR